jgi:hypothetical protein
MVEASLPQRRRVMQTALKLKVFRQSGLESLGDQ